MKTNKLFLLVSLIADLNLIPAGSVTAQTFTTLHSFTATPYQTNSDGANPIAGLITNSAGNTLYGTAFYGGSSGDGTVFAVNTDGAGFTNLHSFSAAPAPYYTNSDGVQPSAGLVLSGNTLYGTAAQGGSADWGTVFAVNTDGTGFTNLHSFNGSDGSQPAAGFILSGILYGTASIGGSWDKGTVFAVNTGGTGFTNLHSFAAGGFTSDGFFFTNSDGANPGAGLISSGNTLYGTAVNGGSGGVGTVFAVNTDGTGFTNLHSFAATPLYPKINSDGAYPSARLVLWNNILYGTAQQGGSSGNGTVFAVNTDGTGFTNLHSFTATSGSAFTNTDGSHPGPGLILSGNTLYGTALNGGSSGVGTVFAMHTDGTGLTNLHSFSALNNSTNSDGVGPQGLILSGNALYGSAAQGGSSGNGTVFSLSFRPQLTITPSGTNVILSWPLSFAGFSYGGYYLQDTSNLLSPNGWISTPDTNLPVITNGQIRVTRPMLGPQWSYRLAR